MNEYDWDPPPPEFQWLNEGLEVSPCILHLNMFWLLLVMRQSRILFFFHRGSHRSPDSECWLFHGVGSLKPTDGDRMVTSFWLFFLAFVEGVKLLLVILFLSGLEK